MGAFLPALGTLVGSVAARLTIPPIAVRPFIGYRPPQWATRENPPALIVTTKNPQTGKPIAYVFDTALELEHDLEAVITLNPVMTGASISDHAYLMPPVVMVEILMSDTIQSFYFGQFATGPSRSVSAYQTLKALMQARAPLTIATRLDTYDRMLIKSIRPRDNAETRFGLRAVVTFQQILTASVEQAADRTTYHLPGGGTVVDPMSSSAFPQTTAQTILGQQNVSPVSQTIVEQNNIGNVPPGINLPALPQVPNAGQWSSYPVSALSTIVP